MKKEYKVFKFFALAVYISFISYFGFIAKIAGRVKSDHIKINLLPFETIKMYLNINDFQSMIASIINLLGNLIVFMPIGAFVTLFIGVDNRFNKLSLIFVAGLLFSFAVESIQLILSVGVFDVDDLILNTIGAILGWYLFKIFIRVKEMRLIRK